MTNDLRPAVPSQRLAWTVLAACMVAQLGTITLDRLNPAVGLWFSELFCLLGVTWALTRWSGRAPASYVRLSWPGLPAVLFAAALALANFFGLAAPINAVSEHFAPESLKELTEVSHLLDQLSSMDLWLFSGGAVFAAAFCEEFLFRGVVQQGLSASGAHPAEAIFRTALVFALFHLNLVSLVALLELGLLFGFLYHRTGSLIPGMVAHATQNLTSLGLYFLDRSRTGPEASGELSATQILGMAGMGIIVMAMLFQLGKAFPSVWGRPRVTPFERPRVSLARAFGPWLAAASLSLAGWYLVDRRGIELGLVDFQVELPLARPEEASEQRAARSELEGLRKRARAGEVPVDVYRDGRRALRASLVAGPPPPK